MGLKKVDVGVELRPPKPEKTVEQNIQEEWKRRHSLNPFNMIYYGTLRMKKLDFWIFIILIIALGFAAGIIFLKYFNG